MKRKIFDNKLVHVHEVMFKVRTVPCSFNKTVYEEDRDSFNCQSSINVYHCIQNERNRSGEICIQPVWVQPSKSYIHIQEVDNIILHIILNTCMLGLIVFQFRYVTIFRVYLTEFYFCFQLKIWQKWNWNFNVIRLNIILDQYTVAAVFFFK